MWHFEEVSKNAKALTPVPGGVGPMTIACLLKNTIECFKRLQNLILFNISSIVSTY